MRKFVLSVICLAAFLITAEGYCRCKGYVHEYTAEEHLRKYVQFSPLLGWSRENPYTEEDPERSPEKPCYETYLPNGARASHRCSRPKTPINVLVLGCSYTFGQGVNDDETYVWLLNDHYSNITFTNYARSGYGTLQCLLLEELLLQNQQYDYVIYAAIPDHLYRNNACFHWDPVKLRKSGTYASTINQTIKTDSPRWYVPTASIEENGELCIRPADYHWIGDTHSVIINTLKRIYILRSGFRNLSDRDNSDEQLRELFWRLVYRMNDVAEQHNSKFAVIYLNNLSQPALLPPTPKELAKYKKNSSVKISPTLPFPFIIATNGCDSDKDDPQFHVSGKLEYHMNGRAHRNWADHIILGLDKLIRNS